MNKPRIFLGSSGKQEKLLLALERGLDDVAEVVPWTTSFNPGTTTLERLIELTRDVDFAVFVFAQDDWTIKDSSEDGQASPRDNVVFEAGLFGGVLGMRRTLILHANGAKLPTDLLGLTCVRYGATTPAEIRVLNQKLRKAIANETSVPCIEGQWWQFSLTQRTESEPSAVSLLRISRDKRGRWKSLGVHGRKMARYRRDIGARQLRRSPDFSGIFYFWKGERPLDIKRSAVGGDGRDQVGVDRPCVRVFHNSYKYGSELERANIRSVLARRCGGREHPGWKRR
jgi:hypothetical protein